MTTSKAKLPYFQFSIRSLLLLTLFVAVLCSFGVCTHWLGPVVLAAIVLTGGVAGRIVAGIRAGFQERAVYATFFFLIVLSRNSEWWTFAWKSEWLAWTEIAALIGGVVGGFTVRPRKGR